MVDMTSNELVHEGDERPSREKVTERFSISYTDDFGYRLHPGSDFQAIITPKFLNQMIREEFGKYMEVTTRKENVGKVVYCDCTGLRYENHGRKYFEILEAHLFIK